MGRRSNTVRSGHEPDVTPPADRDRQRFEALFRTHYPTVLRYLLRRTDRHTAEELAAETFAVAWRRLNDVPRHEVPWLLVTAGHQLANQRRGAARRTTLTAHAAAVTPTTAGDHADAIGDRDHVLRALGALREADREVLLLIAWDDLSHADAARVLGVTRIACSARFTRARRRLRAALDRPEPHPAVLPQIKELPS